MEVVNKKVFLVLIMFGIFFTFFIYQNISDNRTELEEVFLENDVKNSSMFAIMLEQEDEDGNSTYIESSDNIWPIDYKYNSLLSGCLDQNGINVPDVLSYDAKTKKAIVKTKGVTYCYLYFDKDKSVYAKVVSDYTNNTGALLLSETESDEYPVYYYSGDITNNNILYANFCWKMLRTTETGGVKLIYNGVPDEAEDGTLTCDNTGTETQIGTSSFNSSANSLAYAGYMYNTVYNSINKDMTEQISILTSKYFSSSSTTSYYYGDTATWNGSRYVLSNSDGSAVTKYSWVDNYLDLLGKYTCLSTTATGCTSVSYVAATTKSYMYYYNLSNGKTNDDYKIKLATSVTDNGDGTYTLVNPIEVTRADWYTNYSNYKNYYYCSDLTSDTCGTNDTIMYYLNGPYSTGSYVENIANVYKYGNSVTYENGIYTLVDKDTSSIMEFWDWYTNYNQITNNHYTCFNTTGKCEEVYYIYYAGNTSARYIALSGSKKFEDALYEMLYADDVNKTDSKIKNYIDTWYVSNILDKTDVNEMLYSTYLENTIWCNDREIEDLKGWDPNGGDLKTNIIFKGSSSPSLDCSNKTDQFTLKVEVGGTEGYGNNALDYPIGIITLQENTLSNSVTSSKSSFWMLTPSYYDGSSNYMAIRYKKYSGSIYQIVYQKASSSSGVRPSVSLSNKVEILEGDGSVTLPYQVELSE